MARGREQQSSGVFRSCCGRVHIPTASSDMASCAFGPGGVHIAGCCPRLRHHAVPSAQVPCFAISTHAPPGTQHGETVASAHPHVLPSRFFSANRSVCGGIDGGANTVLLFARWHHCSIHVCSPPTLPWYRFRAGGGTARFSGGWHLLPFLRHSVCGCGPGRRQGASGKFCFRQGGQASGAAAG